MRCCCAVMMSLGQSDLFTGKYGSRNRDKLFSQIEGVDLEMQQVECLLVTTTDRMRMLP